MAPSPRLALPLLLLPLAALAVREQERGLASLGGTWLQHAERFCMSKAAEILCDGETVISLYSAAYSKTWKAKCGPPLGPQDVKCHANVTGKAKRSCQGKRRCNLPADWHDSCEGAFSMRVAWNCVAGSGPEDAAPPKAPEEAEEASSEAAATAAPTEEDEEAAFELVDRGAVRGKHPEAKQLIEKVRKDPEHNVSFVPCFRKQASELVQMLRHVPMFAQFFTGCPVKEECYWLRWEDGREFTNPEVPPSEADVRDAGLLYVREGTGQTSGVKFAPYHHWGICLPKDKSVDFALAVFNSMKEAI